ncbi:MAG TPA: 3'-5' exonuclease [Anaerolineae bacterium]|nr:3'-5' exonuclease [Anaerolineae bacterium]
MHISEPYYLIVDLEATCSHKNKIIPRHEMEIIEIGAVILNNQTFTIESEFQTFIRPQRHPQLTPFCTELTTITQDQVDPAPLFPQALDEFVTWYTPYLPARFGSWGKYDYHQFIQDCRYHEIIYPLPEHINIKRQFSKAIGQSRDYGLNNALKHLQLTFDGTPHRGLDDARNIARIVTTILSRDQGS